MAAIQDARARQLPLLNRATKIISLKSTAEATRSWLLGNPVRYLNADEEAFWGSQ
jgi:hypothetical protein